MQKSTFSANEYSDFSNPNAAAIYFPQKNSTELRVSAFERPTAVRLFNDDYCADGRLRVTGQFDGRWSVATRAAAKIDGARLLLSDETQIDGELLGSELRVRLRPESLGAHVDLGNAMLERRIAGGQRVEQWVNPYLRFECDREFGKRLYGVGAVHYFNAFVRSHARANFRRKVGGFDWNVQYNSLLRFNGAFFNTLFTALYTDRLLVKNRRAMLGYESNGVNANVEIGFEGANPQKWELNDATLTFSCDLRRKGIIGAFASALFANGKSALTTDFGFAYSANIGRRAAMKAKATAKGALSLFGDFRVFEGFSVQPSIATTIGECNKKGFFAFPFDFGLKVKFER